MLHNDTMEIQPTSLNANAAAAPAVLVRTGTERATLPAMGGRGAAGTLDFVAIGTPAELRGKADELRTQSQALETEAHSKEGEAGQKELESDLKANEARQKEFEAQLKEREAREAQQAADEATEKQRQAESAAQDTRAQAEAKQALAFQKEQEAELQRAQAENLLASGELEKFNQGVFLLSLADAGLQNAESLRTEVITLQSNVQASLDAAESNRVAAAEKKEQKKELDGAGQKAGQEKQEKLELSERAKAAADALKLEGAERRKAAEKLQAEAAACEELAELGPGGFLVVH